jgi:heat-inducible transcriptional repressor
MNADSSSAESLNERAQHLLRVLVQSYIREGQPVGSRNLSRDSGLSLSSATIRNVMADLEELGFVTSPHTSAGRVPTDRGYRFFVDSLLRAELPQADSAELVNLREQFESAREGPKELVASASQLLSRITHLAGLVTMPMAPAATLTQIEFVNLTENRVLVVLVFNDREVQNRIVQLDRRYGPGGTAARREFPQRALPQPFARRAAQRVAATDEGDARLDQPGDARCDLDRAAVCAPGTSQDGIEYVIAGETNLMGLAELSSVDKLKRLFEAFTEKRDILHLLDQSLRADGVQIFIGHESGYQILDDGSVITAPYSTGEGVAGVLGVIGPTRMAYERVIPIVDITAKLLGSALNSRR